jgi:hypothetical protein
MVNNSVLAGLGIGAALAFVFDPDRGARRRALVRDQFVRASRKTRDGLDATMRDVANRSRGVAASVRGRLRHGDIDDRRLVGPRLDILQDNWAPATQTLVATAGIMLGGALMAIYSRR